MAEDKYETAKKMLDEASKIAKTGTRQQYRNALKAVEDYAEQKGMKDLKKAVNKKRDATS